MLTLNQKKILKLLAINCRFTNKDIAKSVGISEDAVAYQIEKLIVREKLSSFVANFVINKFGFYHHHYLIRVKDLDKLNVESLKEIKEIFFINTSTGNYDIQLIIAHSTDEELIRVKEQIDTILRDNISESVMLKFFKQYKFTNMTPIYDVAVKIPANRKNPLYKLNKENWYVEDVDCSQIPSLSLGEKQTIKQLIKNARATYSEIGKNTSQSYETVRQQIIKFAQKGYIGNFGAFPNYEKYGYFGVFFLMNVAELDDKKILAYVATKKNIFYAAKLIGKYNLILYYVAEKPTELHRESYELRQLFKEKVLGLEMLTFEKTAKSVQFPMVLLD